MFLTRSEYDRGVNTFSPEGRLFQGESHECLASSDLALIARFAVEYATEAIKLGSTAIGIATSEGVVLAVEKRLTSPLLVNSTCNTSYEMRSEHVNAGAMVD